MNERLEAEIRNKVQENPTICRIELRDVSSVFADVHDMNTDRNALRDFVDSLRPSCSDSCVDGCPYAS